MSNQSCGLRDCLAFKQTSHIIKGGELKNKDLLKISKSRKRFAVKDPVKVFFLIQFDENKFFRSSTPA